MKGSNEMKEIKLADNTAEIQPGRGKGRPFKKGQSGNPKGKPKGAVSEVTKFKEAIALFEKEQKKSIYDLILKKALSKPQVLIAIFKALIPQQTESSIKVENVGRPYKDLSDEELIIKANEIFNRTTASGSRRDIRRA